MNKRIQELAEQAAENYTETFKWEYLPDIDRNIFEKFAELILLDVRLLIADERIEYYSDEADDALVSMLISIEKHFGVKE